MKKILPKNLRTVFYLCLLITSFSCGKDDPEIVYNNNNQLNGEWFRSFNNRIAGNGNQDSFERGEIHVILNFGENGNFTHRTIFLGIYENTTLTDTSAVIIRRGSFDTALNSINISLLESEAWDSRNSDSEAFEEQNVNTNYYQDATFQIIEDRLNLTYYFRTDVFSEEQETPGLEKREESYMKL